MLHDWCNDMWYVLIESLHNTLCTSLCFSSFQPVLHDWCNDMYWFHSFLLLLLYIINNMLIELLTNTLPHLSLFQRARWSPCRRTSTRPPSEGQPRCRVTRPATRSPPSPGGRRTETCPSTFCRSHSFFCLFLTSFLCPSFHFHHSLPFSFQPVLHDWCNKGCGMCYPVCGMVHIKEPLQLTNVAAAGFLSHYQNGP